MTVSAYHNYANDKNQELKIELAEFLKDVDLAPKSDDSFTVIFSVNSKKEVIVIDISNEKIAELIKSKLNYKSVKTSNFEVNKIYILPLKIYKSKLIYN
jgi:hypothetical protein